MMAVILAGGKGSRLRPLTVTVPKPLLPLGDVPILEVVLRQIAAGGGSRVVIALGHMAHLVEACIGNGDRWNLEVEYCHEEEPLGTAGALRLLRDPEESFLVMNGDLLTTLDYRKFFRLHQERNAWATIAVSRREVKIDYGVIEMNAHGGLSRYIEKPVIPYHVSMGINVLSRRALAHIPPIGIFDMPQLMQALVAAGKPVLCHDADCYWQDIGRLDDYDRASADFAAEPARFLPPE
jgi:NDP-sugar pyrophosphorylase family protein